MSFLRLFICIEPKTLSYYPIRRSDVFDIIYLLVGILDVVSPFTRRPKTQYSIGCMLRSLKNCKEAPAISELLALRAYRIMSYCLVIYSYGFAMHIHDSVARSD